jgi:hypothetical protein
MFRSANHVASGAAQRAREEMGDAWAHLLAAAEYGARQAGVATRRQGAIARERAAAAVLALRGEQPPSPWRWLAVGLAAGVAIGSAGALILGRRMQDVDLEAVKQRASAAAANARHTAGHLADRVGSRGPSPDKPPADAGQGSGEHE